MIHLAGDPVKCGDYVIQRCLLCGTQLDFTDLRRVMMPSGDTEYATFQLGGLYEISDGYPRTVAKVGETESPTIDPGEWSGLCVSDLVSGD